MQNVANARINTFGIAPKADVPPSEEESIFVLTAYQLQDIISRTIQPLQDEVVELKTTVAGQQEKIADMGRKLASLESLQEAEITRVCVDIAQDRRRLAALETTQPQPLQKDRGEILRALIVANGGKMLAKEARQKMHLSRSRFSELLASMDGDIELKPFHLKKNQKVIVLK